MTDRHDGEEDSAHREGRPGAHEAARCAGLDGYPTAGLMKGGSSMDIVTIVVVVLIVLFVLGYFGRARLRG